MEEVSMRLENRMNLTYSLANSIWQIVDSYAFIRVCRHRVLSFPTSMRHLGISLETQKKPIQQKPEYIFLLYNFIYLFHNRYIFNSKVLTVALKYSIVAINRKGSDRRDSLGNSMPETSGGNGKD